MGGSDIGRAPEDQGERPEIRAVYDAWRQLQFQGKERSSPTGPESSQPGAPTRQEMEGYRANRAESGADAASSRAIPRNLPDSQIEPSTYDQGLREIGERVERVNSWRKDVSPSTRRPESGIQETIIRARERISHLEERISHLKGIESRLEEMGLPRVSEREGLNSQSAGLNREQDEINEEKPDEETIEKQQEGWKIVKPTGGVLASDITELEAAFHKAQGEKTSSPQGDSKAGFQHELVQGAWRIVEPTGNVRALDHTKLEAAPHEALSHPASPLQESPKAGFQRELVKGAWRAAFGEHDVPLPPPELRAQLRGREEAVEARRAELIAGIEEIDGVIGDLERSKELRETEKSVLSRPIEIAQARLAILQARFTDGEERGDVFETIRKNPERHENPASRATSAQELKAIEDASAKVEELNYRYEELTTELREIDVNLAKSHSKRALLVDELNDFRVREE